MITSPYFRQWESSSYIYTAADCVVTGSPRTVLAGLPQRGMWSPCSVAPRLQEYDVHVIYRSGRNHSDAGALPPCLLTADPYHLAITVWS